MSHISSQTTYQEHKYDQTMMKTAELWAQESYCKRRKVGAVIAKDSRIIANGYNGRVSGAGNDCEDQNGLSRPDLLHAEQNSIFFAAKKGISTEGCTIYVTLSPCYECSKAIIQSGIKRVVYKEPYTDTTPLEFLQENGVEVHQIS